MDARGVTIRVPHDTIRISIQRSRYDMYLDTYLSTVRCQRDTVSSMKTETPVIRSTAHNLLLQWMEYLLLQLPLVGRKHDFAQFFQVYIRLFPSTWSEKMCFDWSFSRIVMHIVSCESRYDGSVVSIHIVVTKYRCIAMHRWIVTPLMDANLVPCLCLESPYLLRSQCLP